MTKRLNVLLLVALPGIFCLQAINAQEPERRFAGVVVYGTDIFDAEALREEFAAEAEALMSLMAAGNPSEMETEGEPIVQGMREELASRGDFALLDVGWGIDASPDLMTLVITVEAVERADRDRRMPFREPPTGNYEDPGGILATWENYEDAAVAMMLSGELFNYDMNCPVLHCFYSFEPPELAPFLERFNAAAREYEDLLYSIAENDQDSEHRARALLTLAHTDDPERLLPTLSRAIYDPDGGVRNDAMRIMLYMAERNPELPYPVADLIQAMDFPGSAERNKAVSVLQHLAASPQHARIIREQGLSNLLKLLRSPGDLTHVPAYEILKTLSNEEYGARDYAAWEAWAERQGND